MCATKGKKEAEEGEHFSYTKRKGKRRTVTPPAAEEGGNRIDRERKIKGGTPSTIFSISSIDQVRSTLTQKRGKGGKKNAIAVVFSRYFPLRLERKNKKQL